ncbi:MAG TPA: carbohydrate ABC transporter permease [Anaerolineales bacterium]|nr:carbohydrate ABC transporter permease [Anaerolineales bacterium]
MGLKTQNRLSKLLAFTVALILVIWLIFPPAWMILTAFKAGRDVFALPPKLIFLPTLENFISIFGRPDLIQVFINTVVISIVASSLTLVFGSMAAYSIARFRTGGQPLLFGTLVFRVLPPIVIGLPFFIVFSRLGLIDTIEGLIIAYVAFLLPNTIWLMIPFFGDIPIEIEESALVDGCSRFGSFVRIVIPLAQPGLIVTGIYNLLGSWNHFFYGLILSTFNARTLPVEASNFVGEYALQWGEVSAIGSLLIIPPILVAFFLQKYLVKGLTLGAVKG